MYAQIRCKWGSRLPRMHRCRPCRLHARSPPLLIPGRAMLTLAQASTRRQRRSSPWTCTRSHACARARARTRRSRSCPALVPAVILGLMLGLVFMVCRRHQKTTCLLPLGRRRRRSATRRAHLIRRQHRWLGLPWQEVGTRAGPRECGRTSRGRTPHDQAGPPAVQRNGEGSVANGFY
jgi:hypothetical protein